MTVRATQTNEAARCAVLLPVLSRIEGPISLIEAGASAGLCLYPDRYSYRYCSDGTVAVLDPADGVSSVQISCDIESPSIPARLPHVAWRAGADLNPIDPRNEDAVSWLETLIWPEHEERRRRLHAAARIAAQDPPELLQGDLLSTIPQLIDKAPSNTTVVVFHSAVLIYLEPDKRQEFARLMLARENVTWISNEGSAVLPSIAEQVDRPPDGRMILAVNHRPIALTGPHGQSFEAL